MPCVPALVRWMIVFPVKSTSDTSNGELPKSNPAGARPSTSPMQICPIPAARNARASSTPPTITMCPAPLANATAAVVKARNTSMTATAPLARPAPSIRLSMRISISPGQRRAEPEAHIIGDPGSGLVGQHRAQQFRDLGLRLLPIGLGERMEEIVGEGFEPRLDRGRQYGRARHDLDLLDCEARVLQLLTIGGGGGEIPGAQRQRIQPAAVQHGAHRDEDCGGVAVSAHLGDEPPTRLQCPPHALQYR